MTYTIKLAGAPSQKRSSLSAAKRLARSFLRARRLTMVRTPDGVYCYPSRAAAREDEGDGTRCRVIIEDGDVASLGGAR